jgi:HEAT repeat protein
MPAPSAVKAAVCAVAAVVLLRAAPARATPLDATAEEQVIKALSDRSGPMKVRLQAALILGHGGGLASVPPLLEALGDPEFPVRAAAALSLGNVGDARAGVPLAGRLEDPESFVRTEAVEGLVHLLRRNADPTLASSLARLEPSVKVKLLGVVAGLEPGVADGVVATALTDPDPTVAEAVRAVLAGWKPPEVQRFLLAQLHDPRPAVRAAAAELLGQRRFSLAVPRLEEMLLAPEETPETVSAARHALRALAEQLDLVQLREAALHGQGDVQLKAMAVLAAVRDPAAYELLAQLLDSPLLPVRAAAAVDLGVLGDARASGPLAVLAGRAENASIQLTLQSALRAVERGGEK